MSANRITAAAGLAVGLGLAVWLSGCESPQGGPDEPAAQAPAPPPPLPAGEGDEFAQAEAAAKVAAEEREHLVQSLVDQARQDLARDKLDSAEARLNEALALLPRHKEANRLRHEVLRAKGTSEDYRSLGEMLEDEETVKRDQLRIEAQAHYEKGQRYFDEGEYEKAEKEMERFVDVVRWSSYDLELDHLLDPARDMQRLAGRRAREKATREAALRERQAREEILQAEEKETQIKRQRIVNLYREAVERFRNGQFDRAETIASRILALNPGDHNAMRLRDQAIMLRHRNVEDEIVRDKVRAWTVFLDDMQEAITPWGDIVHYNPERWAAANARALATASAEAVGPTLSPAAQSIQNKLRNTTISLDFQETPLNEAIDFIREYAGVNIVLDPEVEEAFTDEGRAVTLTINDLPIQSALDILFNLHGLQSTYKENVLFITSSDRVVGDTVLLLHDIRDITATLTDFPGPEIQLVEASAGDIGGGAMFTGEEPAPTFDEESIEELIRTSIAPETWDEDPARFSIAASGGNLIVRNTPEVHAEIERFLDELRSFAGILVTVETRFLEADDLFLEEIGVDWRGLGPQAGGPAGNVPGQGPLATLDDVVAGAGAFQGNQTLDLAGGLFDNGPQGGGTRVSSGFFFADRSNDIRARTEGIFDQRLGRRLTSVGGLSLQWTLLDDARYNWILQAVSKSNQATLLTAPRLTAFNTQRANITIANQVSYIKDFDVEVAQTSQIADPIVDVIQDGLVLDVRPTVSYDLKYITLEIRPTVAALIRPIPVLTTSLGAGTPVSIQLPELVVQSAATTVRVPDRGSILIGGLRNALSQDRKSTVPLVDHIPVLSFLFRRKGRSQELDNLVILVRATITDLAETEQEYLQGY